MNAQSQVENKPRRKKGKTRKTAGQTRDTIIFNEKSLEAVL
ncbi:hypothetical protein [Methanosarcina sp. DH2]|nr:hypothetical protein [Methanosarcina sp. DH2]